MDCSTTSLNENLLPKSPSEPPREDITYKAASKQPSPSPANPLQTSPQDPSDAPLKPPQSNLLSYKTLFIISFTGTAQPNDHKEIFIFDKKQTKWTLLHICWVLWCIYACLSTLPSGFHHIIFEDFDIEDIEGFVNRRIRAPLCMTAPYWFQFIVIYFKDLLIVDIGIGLIMVSELIVGIPMAVAGFLYLYSPEIHADFYNAPVDQSEKALLSIFKRTGKMFLYLLFTYLAARRYRSYLVQREELIKKTQ